MPQEIERKFLVASRDWHARASSPSRYVQAYVCLQDERSLRVRIVDNAKARLTLKIGEGMVRDEFEYDIPLKDARDLIDRRIGNVVEKDRYRVHESGFVWEVDVFDGVLEGLVVAEVELESAADRPVLPGWLGREVTDDPAYGNRSLAVHGLPEGGGR